MNKLRTFLAGLLLMPLLTANATAYAADFDNAIASAHAFTIESNGAIAAPPQVTGWCYYYWGGQWWLLPC